MYSLCFLFDTKQISYVSNKTIMYQIKLVMYQIKQLCIK